MLRTLHLIYIILLLGHALPAAAQTFTLQGRVVDEEGNPVEMVSVSVPAQGKMVMTSAQGRYSMQLLSADSVVVRFSMIGYKTKVRRLVKPRGRQTLQVSLYTEATALAGVDVAGQRIQTGQTEDIKADLMKNTVSTTGNAVEGLIQQQAGVSTHSELSSQYNVRGGAFDENSVYINNVEIYRPFLVRSGQQEGLSVINADMVERIGFASGGFAAKYGDKMSSALDITYKHLTPPAGKKTYVEGTVAASLLGASGYVGLATKKLSWLNGVRYKTNKYLLGSLDTKGEYMPTFLDFQTYLTFRPNQRWTLTLLGNISDNHYDFAPADRETSFGTQQDVKAFRVYFDGKEKDLFRTFFFAGSVERHLTKNTSVALLVSNFNTRERETYDIQGQYWLTQTETSEDLGVGTYFQHARNYLKANVTAIKLLARHKAKRHDIEGAFTFKIEDIKERSAEYEMRDSAGYSIPHTGQDLHMVYSLRGDNHLKAHRWEAYLQDTWRWQGRSRAEADSTGRQPTLYTLNYGLRLAHYDFNGETTCSPRASLAITPSFNQNLTFRLAAGLYYQAPFFKELRDTTLRGGVTTAFLNPKAKSQCSIHLIAGADYRFRLTGRPFRLTAEAYYKALSDLVPYTVNNVKLEYYSHQTCSGHAMGLDVKLYGEFVPGNDSWIAFSVMNTRMKLGGRSLPLPTDQRYSVNLFFTDYFPGTTRWKMSLKLAFADGLPFSAPHKELQSMPFRAPAYKRVDIGMSYRLLDNEKRTRKYWPKNIWLGVDGLNILGINNVNSYYWVTDVTNQQYAVPNYLTGRQINGRVLVEF